MRAPAYAPNVPSPSKNPAAHADSKIPAARGIKRTGKHALHADRGSGELCTFDATQVRPQQRADEVDCILSRRLSVVQTLVRSRDIADANDAFESSKHSRHLCRQSTLAHGHLAAWVGLALGDVRRRGPFAVKETSGPREIGL